MINKKNYISHSFVLNNTDNPEEEENYMYIKKAFHRVLLLHLSLNY